MIITSFHLIGQLYSSVNSLQGYSSSVCFLIFFFIAYFLILLFFGRYEPYCKHTSVQCCYGCSDCSSTVMEYIHIHVHIHDHIYNMYVCMYIHGHTCSYFHINSTYYNVSRLVVSDSLRSPGLYIAHQTPLSVDFSTKKYWSELPFPSPGDLLDLTVSDNFEQNFSLFFK